MNGQQLGHFSLVEKIGEGGMGIVYRARDLKLDRQVAIKLLPESYTGDSDRRMRFIQEARTASSVNHPNIVTIHEIGEYDGKIFIVMELVDGRPLHELIPKQGMRLATALPIAIQVSDALATAHAAGIVHRDLKPANIMVDAQGRAKMLDFGLAKLAAGVLLGADETTLTADPGQPVTEQGVIHGSIPYMSPEQAEGKPVDVRGDIFSFGAVLYEMVTGRRAFRGESKVSTLAAILNKEPQPPSEIAATPPDLERLIARCMRKDITRRYQNMSDVRLALEDLLSELESEKLQNQPAAGLRKRFWAVSLALLALLTVTATIFLLGPTQRRENRERDFVPVRVTSNGPELPVESLALSPDGKYLAYSDPKGIYIRSLAGSETRLLPDTANMGAGYWTADGAKVILADAKGQFFSISLLGDSPRPRGDWAPSRDGAYSFKLANDAVLDIRSSTGTSYSISFDKGHRVYSVEWSMTTGTKWLLVIVGAPGKFWIEGIQLERGTRHVLLPSQPSYIASVGWVSTGELIYWLTDAPGGGRGIYYRLTSVGKQRHAGNLWTMKVDPATGVPSGPPQQLTRWVDFSVTALSTSADGARICLMRSKPRTNVWLGDLNANSTQLTGLRQMTMDDALELPYAWTPDSKSVLFRSDRDGHERIYKQDIAGNTAELITPPNVYPHRARISPDGKWLLYELLGPASDPHDRGLMRMPLGGGEPQLVFHEEESFVVFCGSVPGAPCVVSRKGIQSLFDPMTGKDLGTVQTRPDDIGGWISPDGQHIAFLVADGSGNRIRVADVHGATERVISVAAAQPLRDLGWDASGSGFFATDVQPSTGFARLLHIDRNGAVHVLTEDRFAGDLWAIPSPDGRHLATFRSTINSNVWMVERR